MPKKGKSKKRKDKLKKLKEKRSWSSWFLKAFAISLIGYILWKGIPAFIEYNCMKCALPTLGIGGLISAVILAILNEVRNYIVK